jgi:hypothetical protein
MTLHATQQPRNTSTRSGAQRPCAREMLPAQRRQVVNRLRQTELKSVGTQLRIFGCLAGLSWATTDEPIEAV